MLEKWHLLCFPPYIYSWLEFSLSHPRICITWTSPASLCMCREKNNQWSFGWRIKHGFDIPGHDKKTVGSITDVSFCSSSGFRPLHFAFFLCLLLSHAYFAAGSWWPFTIFTLAELRLICTSCISAVWAFWACRFISCWTGPAGPFSQFFYWILLGNLVGPYFVLALLVLLRLILLFKNGHCTMTNSCALPLP